MTDTRMVDLPENADKRLTSKWAKRYLKMAELVATWSKDPSTQVGAVVVGDDMQILATGYNGFPRGLCDDEHLYEDRSTKYPRVRHAEANALDCTSRELCRFTKAVLFVTHPPCPQCAGQIIQSGVTKVVTKASTPEFFERWDDTGIKMLEEVGIDVIFVGACVIP